jgi:hypothetical protein
MKRLRHVAILASIFFSVFISHVSSRNITSPDSKWSIPTALSIIKEGNTDLDEYKEMLEKYNYFAIERIDGHYYTIYPMGVSLIAIPFVYAIEKSLDILSSTVQKLGKYYTKDREYVPLDYFFTYYSVLTIRNHIENERREIWHIRLLRTLYYRFALDHNLFFPTMVGRPLLRTQIFF